MAETEPTPKRRIATKLILNYSLLLSIIVLALVLHSISREERKVIDEIHNRAILLNKFLMIEVTRDFLQSDYKNVQNMLKEAKDYDHEIERIDFVNEEDLVTASSAPDARASRCTDPLYLAARASATDEIRLEGRSFRLAFPLKIGNTVKGYMLACYSLDKMFGQIRGLYAVGFALLALAIGTVVLFSFALARRITAPILALHAGAHEIIGGNLAFRIAADGDDETAIISGAFNQVTSNLVEKIEQLREYSEDLARSNRELDKKIQELKSLQELGKVISSIFNLEELLRAIVQNASMVMKSNRCSIVLVNEKTGEFFIKIGKGISEDLDIVENIRLKTGGFVTDWCVKHKEPLLVEDFARDERFGGAHGGKYRSGSFIAVPLVVSDRVIGVISITEKLVGEPYNTSDLHLLTIFANQVVIAIENAKLYERLVERERLEKELEIAHTIQMNMLPKDYPTLQGIEISGLSVPAKEVGGDYYDFLPLEGGLVGVTIGDVAGKGVPAALMMVMIRSILRAKIMADHDPQTIVSELNSQILADSDPRMFVTLFYAVIDAGTREMRYTNAGHNYPLIFHAEGDAFESLEDGGLLMGMFEGATYTQGKVSLKTGDVVLFYTDGIVEAMNEKDEMYGFERLRDLVLAHKDDPADRLRDRIIEETRAFTGSAPQYDDMTLIVVKLCN